MAYTGKKIETKLYDVFTREEAIQNSTPSAVSDKPNTSTGYFDLPAGTTEERPTPEGGMLRYNTSLSLAEYYDGTVWKAIDAPPVVTSVSPSTVLTGGATLTISGSNFQSGCSVKFVGTDGSQFISPSVTVNSSSNLTVTTPTTPLQADIDPYSIHVTNPSGLTGIGDSLIDAGSSPTWSTGATLTTVIGGSTISEQLSATDPDGQTVSYSSSDAPSGTSVSSNGLFSGTADPVAADTNKTFTVSATDGVNTTNRTFSILYAKPSILVNGSGQFINTGYSVGTAGYYIIVPEQNMEVFIDMWGAGGGGAGRSSGQSYGCAGGESYGVVTLTAGTQYVLLVGEGGHGGNQTKVRVFPDGGLGDNSGYASAGGGGSTRFGEYTQSGFNLTNSSSNYNNTNAVYYMIAGAGAGGNDYIYNWAGTPAGYGGGLAGAGGGAWYPSGESLNSTGKGGTQSSGGAAGTTPARLSQLSGAAGGKYYGGNGSGSGGGGGYYGGGGARGYYSLGGGGSGFLNPSFVSNGNFATASAGNSTHYVNPNANGYNTGNWGRGGTNNGTAGYSGGFYIIGNGYR
jgi:hypothetical protein